MLSIEFETFNMSTLDKYSIGIKIGLNTILNRKQSKWGRGFYCVTGWGPY